MKPTTALSTLLTVTLTKTTSIVEHSFNAIDNIAASGEVVTGGYLAATKDEEEMASVQRKAEMAKSRAKLDKLK